MINIFNSNYEELGSLNKNLVLQTLGKVKIRYGKKFIDLLDNNGNINVQIPKVLKKVDSVDKINSDGLYLIDNELWAYVDGEKFLVEGDANKTFISYLSDLNLSQDQINIAQKNIGLKFDSLGDVNVDDSIVFIKDKIYYVNNGNFVELTVSLNEPLRSINSENLGMGAENSVLYFRNGRWTYTPLPTGSSEQITLNEPIEGLNNADLGEPTNGQILAFKDNVWQYIDIPTSLQQGDTGILLNFPLSDINSAGISNPLTASQPTNNAIVIAYDSSVWKPVYIPKIPRYIEVIWWWTENDMKNGGLIYYNLLFLYNGNYNFLLPLNKTFHLENLSNGKYFDSTGDRIYDRPNPVYYSGPEDIQNMVCLSIVDESDVIIDSNTTLINKYLVWSEPYVKVFYDSHPTNAILSSTPIYIPRRTQRGPALNSYLNTISPNPVTMGNLFYFHLPNTWYEVTGLGLVEPQNLDEIYLDNVTRGWGFVVNNLWSVLKLYASIEQNNISFTESSFPTHNITYTRVRLTVSDVFEMELYNIGGSPLILYVDRTSDIGGTLVVTLEGSYLYWELESAEVNHYYLNYNYSQQNNTGDISGNEREVIIKVTYDNSSVDYSQSNFDYSYLNGKYITFKVKYNNN